MGTGLAGLVLTEALESAGVQVRYIDVGAVQLAGVPWTRVRTG